MVTFAGYAKWIERWFYGNEEGVPPPTDGKRVHTADTRIRNRVDGRIQRVRTTCRLWPLQPRNAYNTRRRRIGYEIYGHPSTTSRESFYPLTGSLTNHECRPVTGSTDVIDPGHFGESDVRRMALPYLPGQLQVAVLRHSLALYITGNTPYASKSHFSLYLCGFALSVKFTGSKHCGIGMDSSDGHSTAHVSFARQPIRASPSFRLRSENLNSVRLRRTFEAFDRNGDGLITTGELGQALQKLGMPIALSDLQSTVAPFVKTGRAGLDFEDFSALHRSLGDQMFGADALPEGNDNAEEEEEEDLKEAFSVFDEDGDGYISAAELHGVIRRLGLPGAGDVGSCERMIFAVDENKDGRVDFGEFKHMIGTVTVRGF